MKKLIYLLMSLSFVAFASCEDKEEPVNNENTQTEDDGYNENDMPSIILFYKSGTENGHDYVDLGLPSGTLWATCNVGAFKPEEYGNNYAWGETTTKETYSWSTYLGGQFTDAKDCETDKDVLRGVTDIAGTQYDAAKANWGGKWVTPTRAQYDELRNECCRMKVENYNGSNIGGYIFYKAEKSNDKGKYVTYTSPPYFLSYVPHIFLPNSSVSYDGNIDWTGYYWCSSRISFAVAQTFAGGNPTNATSRNRSHGLAVRAVISKDGGGSNSVNYNVNGNVSGVLFYKSGTQDGHDYVDLGLTSGTKWATCNVGATKPEESGSYYAWGETTTKSTYSWDTYKYAIAAYDPFDPFRLYWITKYCNDSRCGKDGFTDTRTVLSLSDDAAYVNWGGSWRMPTHDQLQELKKQCYWVWTENYNNTNVKGYIIYKAKAEADKGVITRESLQLLHTYYLYPLSAAHIFLPAYSEGRGYYWSSSLSDYCQASALEIHYSSSTGLSVGINPRARLDGRTVRAVFK